MLKSFITLSTSRLKVDWSKRGGDRRSTTVAKAVGLGLLRDMEEWEKGSKGIA